MFENDITEKNQRRKSIFSLPWGFITFFFFLAALALFFAAYRFEVDPCIILDATAIGFSLICGLVFWISGIISLIFAMLKRKVNFIFILPVIGILGIITATIPPNLLRYSARPNTCDAPVNLRKLYQAQSDYYFRNHQYAKTFKELDLNRYKIKCHYGSSRYWYYLSPSEILRSDPSNNYSLPSGIEPFATGEHFQIVAVGNIDNDPALDV